MSQHAHLSTLDPEFAALLPLPERKASDLSNIKAVREQARARSHATAEFLKPHLPAESTYAVSEHKVPVERGEITVRSIVPRGAAEGTTFPVLVWFHGGGFVLGDLDMNDVRLKILAVDHQISVVNVDYRLLPENPFPTSWEDCYTATKWVVENAALLSGSFKKGFLVGGQSAGGNLAASTVLRASDDTFFAKTPITGHALLIPVALHPDAPRPESWNAQLLSHEQNKNAPVLSEERHRMFTNAIRAPPEDTRLSILLHPSHAKLPPAYFQIAGLDPLRDEGLLYAKLVEETGVKTKVDVYPGVPHGFDMVFPQLKISARAYKDLDEGITWLLSHSRA